MRNNQEVYAVFSKSLLNPKYWPTWLGVGCLYVLTLLPYPLLCLIGKMLGLLAMRLIKRRVAIAARNIELSFPNMPEADRKKLLRDNFISTGIAVFEAGMAWFWSDRRIRKHATITGDHHISNIQKNKQGIILIGIHFLTLELGARIMGLSHQGVGVYRPNDNPVIDYIQTRGRLKSNKYMLDRKNIKGMIRALKQGELLWYAPDHDYGPKSSIFAPFFAVEKAATTIGTFTLVKTTGAALVAFSPIRIKGGYHIIIKPPLKNFPNDKLSAAILVNKIIEQEILTAPEQYMWLHRRFKTQPPGAPYYYADIDSNR